jgi:hypothetical protein
MDIARRFEMNKSKPAVVHGAASRVLACFHQGLKRQFPEWNIILDQKMAIRWNGAAVA